LRTGLIDNGQQRNHDDGAGENPATLFARRQGTGAGVGLFSFLIRGCVLMNG
jgi:hypothetical protein